MSNYNIYYVEVAITGCQGGYKNTVPALNKCIIKFTQKNTKSIIYLKCFKT